jgi:hypothetical protein
MGQITHRKPQKSFLLSCHTCQRFSGIVICISASPYNQRGEQKQTQFMLACYKVLIAEIFWFGQQTAYDSSLVVWTRRNANDYTTKTLASMARQQK